MNWTKNILSLLMIVVFCADELSAQTTSSAAQVVTFGVRRIAFQAPTASYVANTMNLSPMKVTAGFQSRFQAAVDLRTTTADLTFSSEEPGINVGMDNLRSVGATPESNQFFFRPAITKSSPSSRLLVTVTE